MRAAAARGGAVRWLTRVRCAAPRSRSAAIKARDTLAAKQARVAAPEAAPAPSGAPVRPSRDCSALRAPCS
jgi:hypothetical protein